MRSHDAVCARARVSILFSTGSWELEQEVGGGGVVPRRLRKKTTELPVEDGREELRDQPLVIRLEFPGIYGQVGFGVQVVRVESPDGNQRLLICLVAQMAVRAFPVPPRRTRGIDMRNGIKPRENTERDARVEAVVTNHMKASFG